jgi:macrolide-specific efflux system membrane fusion protein
MKKRRLVAAAVLALALVAGGAWWKSRRAEKAPRDEVVKAERGDVRVTILSTGQVKPQNRVEIKPPISGRVEEVLVREGEIAKKGQILAWLSSVERAALLDAARARGPEELAKWRELYKPTPLVAPLDGVVIARKVEPGQTATAQDAALVMSNRLIVEAQVDETDIGRVKEGQEVVVTLDAYAQEEIPAQVDRIAYEAELVNNVTIYRVEVAPRGTPAFMRSGMTANMTFLVGEKRGVLLLPADAVQEGEDGPFVRVPREDGGKGRPARVKVETGMTDGKRIEIVSGLQEGAAVLATSFRLGKSGESPTSPFMPTRRRTSR